MVVKQGYKRISEYIGIDSEKVCFYPDNTRKLF